MLSLASLLNPISIESRTERLPLTNSEPFTTTSSHGGSPLLLTPSTVPTKKQKMTKDGAIFTKAMVRGEVNYHPFEDFDETTLREIQKFQIYPLGKIREYSRHIPYNSEKKTFLEKTGRESFEGMLSLIVLHFWHDLFPWQSSNISSSSLMKTRIIPWCGIIILDLSGSLHSSNVSSIQR